MIEVFALRSFLGLAVLYCVALEQEENKKQPLCHCLAVSSLDKILAFILRFCQQHPTVVINKISYIKVNLINDLYK